MESLAEKRLELGITRGMVRACRMAEQREAADLVDAGPDLFQRPQRMTRDTFNHWRRMQSAAAQDGVTVLLVSAYRSVDDQCALIRRKLEAGQRIGDIIRVNAIPGFSEHHTGRALDLHDGVGEPLTESFDGTRAFGWLTANAGRFNFVMSYPAGNQEGVIYEPWHWCYRG